MTETLEVKKLIELSLVLGFVWQLRCKLRAEGNKLKAEGNKLRAEGDKVRAEGNKVWAEGVLRFAGNITLTWIYRDRFCDSACVLESGETFEPMDATRKE